MTPRQRAILRTLYATDNAKETARRFHVSDRYVRRVRDEAMRRTGCRTQWELLRLLDRRPRRQTVETVPLWHLGE